VGHFTIPKMTPVSLILSSRLSSLYIALRRQRLSPRQWLPNCASLPFHQIAR
jgi:hypothetical protein